MFRREEGRIVEWRGHVKIVLLKKGACRQVEGHWPRQGHLVTIMRMRAKTNPWPKI